MVSSTDFLRASERTTAIATLNRRHHAEGSPLPRREQWARQGRSLESLTPRPGIRELSGVRRASRRRAPTPACDPEPASANRTRIFPYWPKIAILPIGGEVLA